MAAVSPLAGKTDLISFTVKANGAKIPDVYELSQIRVHKQINRIPSAKLVLLDGNPSSETFTISESANFVPGSEIEIAAGYHGVETTIFKGIVVKHGIKVKKGGKSYLVVSCFDKAIKMTLGRKSAYLGKSDNEIIQKLIKDAGLTADVESTTASHDSIIRYYATDWDFVVCRAEINGKIVTVDDGKVTVKAPDVGATAELLIENGDALQEIDAEIDVRTQLQAVKCSAWDFSTQKIESGDSKEPRVNEQGNITGKKMAEVMGLSSFALQSSAPETAATLGVWADAQLLKSRLARIRGNVSFRGNAKPKPGQVVELAGVGARFNGTAFVSSVRHTIEEGNWITEVGFGLSPQWFVEEQSDIEAPSAAGLLPGIHGMQIGTVKQIDQDPDGQTRILVDVPVIDPAGDGIWARLASGYATQNAGIFFVPEVGDEVILGFINNDPRFPVIIGSLYSSQRTPPYTADAPNTNKAIVTKAQIKISMDDVKKKLQIETPGGHIITLNDEDQSITIVDSNKNKMHFSSGGVTLDSCADIAIKATGGIKITAGTGIDIKAGTDLNLQALNVNAKASVALSAQGQASAEVTSSGQMTVRGAIVMIN